MNMGSSTRDKFVLVCLGLALAYLLCPTRDTVSVVHQDNSTIRFNISGSIEVLDLSKCGGEVRMVATEIVDDFTGFSKIWYDLYSKIKCFNEAKEMMHKNKMSFQDVVCFEVNRTCEASLYVPNARPLALKKIRVSWIDAEVPSIKACEFTRSNPELDEMNCTAAPVGHKDYIRLRCEQIEPGDKYCVSILVDKTDGKIHAIKSDFNSAVQSHFGLFDAVIRDWIV